MGVQDCLSCLGTGRQRCKSGLGGWQRGRLKASYINIRRGDLLRPSQPGHSLKLQSGSQAAIAQQTR